MSQTWTQAHLEPCPQPAPPRRVSKHPSRQFQDTSHISLPPSPNNTPSIPGPSHPHPSVPYTRSRGAVRATTQPSGSKSRLPPALTLLSPCPPSATSSIPSRGLRPPSSLWRICMACLALELVGPWVELNFSVCMEAFQRMQWHPTPVLLPGKSHGRRSLVGCSPWGH